MSEQQDVARVGPLPAIGGEGLAFPHARLFTVAAAGALPDGAELVFSLADGVRVVYVPVVGAGPVSEIAADPFLRGNQFKPLHGSPTTLAAAISIAAGRRVETGPESARIFVFLRGTGLVFLENGDTLRFAPGDHAYVPAGEPAKLWAQGPDEDVLAIVMQPQAEAVPRRTLAGEIAKRRAPDE